MSHQTRFSDPHPSASQFPPSQGGYHWTCELCNSILGTREQAEQHQFLCPVRASSQGSAQFPPHGPQPGIPATHGYLGAYDGRNQQPPSPRATQPYHTGMQSQRPQQHDPTANVQYPGPCPQPRHPPTSSQRHPLASTAPPVPDLGRYGKRQTVLIWAKETSTLEREVNYLDNVDGGITLRWSQELQCFRCEVDLSLGQHSGVLSLGVRDSILPIRPFAVEEGGPRPQNILISFEKDQNSEPLPQRSNATQSDFMRTGANITPGERAPPDRVRDLEEMVSKLRVDLEARSSELAQQREAGIGMRQALSKRDEEDRGLIREVDELKRENSILKARLEETEKGQRSERGQNGSGFQVEGEDLRLRVKEWESERERLYTENDKLKKDKRVAGEYADLLRRQKQEVEAELREARDSLESSQREREELSRKLKLLSKEEAAPPVPSRSKPPPRDPRVAKGPQEVEYSPELGPEPSGGVKTVSLEGRELRLRPITNLVEARKHQGHRVVCECEGPAQAPRYLEGVLMCLFEDGESQMAGVKFPAKIFGSSDGTYKGKEWFDAPEGMGGFFLNSRVYIST